MNTVQKIAIAYILCVALMAFGFAVGKYEVFPHQYVQQVIEFIAWKPPAGTTSIQGKLQNQLGVKPSRFVYPYPSAAADNTSTLALPQIKTRRDNPSIYIAPEHRSGYRAIFGAMDFDNYFWGGLLIGPDSNVIHTWKLSTDHLPLSTKPDQQKNMYGLALLPDGSVIYSMHEEGGGIVKVDACGNILWNLEGKFHHTVSLSEDNSYFWTYMGSSLAFHHKLAKVSTSTGEIVKIIDMKEAYRKNEFTHIFNLQKNFNSVKPSNWWNISHGNDIEELDASKSADFPAFNSGDLLLSYRSQNVIFILDPETLEVKWWRIGATDRQHDADWENGVITAFSNNNVGARKGHSDIVRIDVDTMKHDTLVDGKRHSIYSTINARQQLTAFDTRIITSSTQGWVLEVDDNDKLVFSFLNTYDSEDKTSLHLAEAYRLKPGYFTHKFWEECES